MRQLTLIENLIEAFTVRCVWRMLANGSHWICVSAVRVLGGKCWMSLILGVQFVRGWCLNCLVFRTTHWSPCTSNVGSWRGTSSLRANDHWHFGTLMISSSRGWAWLSACTTQICHCSPCDTQSRLCTLWRAEFDNSVVAGLPLAAGRPTHPKGPVSVGLFVNRPSRPPAGVRLYQPNPNTVHLGTEPRDSASRGANDWHPNSENSGIQALKWTVLSLIHLATPRRVESFGNPRCLRGSWTYRSPMRQWPVRVARWIPSRGHFAGSPL